MNAIVKDVMSTHVVAVRKNATFKEMAARLRQQLAAADLMTKPAVTISPDELVSHAARLMYSRRVKRLPVVAEDGTLVGIVSRADVLSVYGRPDEDIRREITQDLILETYLCDPAKFTVTVKDGIVTIEGGPETAAVGRDIIESAKHVEAVVAVRDRLTYPPAEHYTPNPMF